jgi:hypothetical protein
MYAFNKSYLKIIIEYLLLNQKSFLFCNTFFNLIDED